jgi:hypothetical protein
MKPPKKRIDRSIDVDAISDDDVLDTTTPRHDNQSPEQKFLHKFEAAKELRRKFSGLNKSPEEIAALVGVEPSQENLDMIHDLMKSRFWNQVYEDSGYRFSKSIETKIRQMVTEAVAEAMELDERWREDDEAEWHKSITGGQQQNPSKPAAAPKPTAPAATGAPENLQKARQLVALATQIAARKNPVMAKHIQTLASQFEDLVKSPNPENNAKAMKMVGQISSLAKSLQ